MEEFKPGWENKRIAFGLGGLMLLIFLVNVFVPFGPGDGPRLVKLICVLFWTPLFLISMPMYLGMVATIRIRPDRIERITCFGTRVIRWDRLELLRRMDKGDSRFELRGDGTRFDINWTGYAKRKQLQLLLLEKLKEPALGNSFKWRVLFQPVSPFVLMFFVILCLGAGGGFLYGYFTAQRDGFLFGIGIFLIVGAIMLVLCATGLNMVSDRVVRSDPFLGWRRELRYEQIGLIEFGVIGEYGEAEAMFIYGPGKKLTLSSVATPDYAQVRDLILSRVKCPVKGKSLQ
ncbi:MAG: hypothetical protein ACKVQS_00400 [Fimbriimonadaceae bacterium]